MTVSRREFGLAAAAVAVAGASAAQSGSGNVTRESLRAMLEGQAGAALFDDEAWLELLHRAVELNAETRADLRRYELSSDAEPAITFVRY